MFLRQMAHAYAWNSFYPLRTYFNTLHNTQEQKHISADPDSPARVLISI